MQLERRHQPRPWPPTLLYYASSHMYPTSLSVSVGMSMCILSTISICTHTYICVRMYEHTGVHEKGKCAHAYVHAYIYTYMQCRRFAHVCAHVVFVIVRTYR